MRRGCARAVAGLAMALVVGGGVATAGAAPDNRPVGPVETAYFQPGPWAVVSQQGFGCCDSSGHAFDIWYPADLGKGGFKHPIITWGDGTWAHPGQYAYLLSHLASWGFVVIAPDNSNTGSGREMLDAVDYLIGQNDDPASPFHGKLDTDSIGAMGHSQGAIGAVNALAQSGGRIKTAVTIELVAQLICPAIPVATEGEAPFSCADPRQLTSGSIFYVNGSNSPISPSTQPISAEIAGLQSARSYYDATPDTLDKARATLIGPNHNDIQGQPDCDSVASACVNGVDGFLGFPTAWLMDRLRGDRRAHDAFVSGTGELFAPNPNWTEQQSNITR
ncbi:poly(ethylene terephthalate) hydrolase family protein [Nocardia sp. CDC160]|uniref:poly(ethylene terephthalate) hydrolase family protein n=1 Tax=Nocardia sp. CDC160 TaxID=3112166 RepID=UPI002DB9FFE4|nr:hypothetical protein [Nocardia sp. CDC160]MEC3915680.1 hypothetical protein [Nocardia sp. CDC160]